MTRLLTATRLTFRLLEHVAIATPPPSARILEVWYPLIRDDLHQRVLDLALDPEPPAQLTHDPEHGNPLLYLRCSDPPSSGLDFTVSYLIQVCAPAPLATVPETEEEEAPSPLRSSVRSDPAGSDDPLRQAIHLLRLVRARHPAGQGRVDALLNLCRRAGLRARPVVGHRVLVGSRGDGIAVAHRWVELFLPSRGWLPGDPSCDASSLGSLGCDHVARSRGNRILLQPVQRGRRLTTLSAPYGEVDGRRIEVRSQILATAHPDLPIETRPPTPERLPALVEVLTDDRELGRLHPPPRRLCLRPGTSLTQGRPLSDWLFVVARGRIRLARLTTSGRRLELESVVAPGFFTGTRLHGGLVEVTEEAEMRVLSRSHVEQLARRWPHLAVELLENLSRRLTDAEERLEYLAYHSVADRLALALLRHHREEDGLVDDVTHQELGDLIGASRETVTRLLHSPAFRSAVRVLPRRIQVTDPAVLVEMLEG
jgi:CRP/FNR family cyclic AMP-dependent transcriptional regulator